jgi:hypothetical protein
MIEEVEHCRDLRGLHRDQPISPYNGNQRTQYAATEDAFRSFSFPFQVSRMSPTTGGNEMGMGLSPGQWSVAIHKVQIHIQRLHSLTWNPFLLEGFHATRNDASLVKEVAPRHSATETSRSNAPITPYQFYGLNHAAMQVRTGIAGKD